VTPFQAYVAYLAVKTHFTSETYDFFKYQGKVAAKVATFETRRDRNRFEKLSRKPDPLMFLASNISRNPGAWIGDLVSSDEAQANFESAKKFIDSFSYVMPEQLRALPLDQFASNFMLDERGGVPAIRAMRAGKISMEAIATIDGVMSFNTLWTASKDPTYVVTRMQVKKYGQFISRQIEPAALAKAMRSVFDEDGTRIK